MAKEIERKFLVKSDSYTSMAVESHTIVQAYLSAKPDATVRVRILDDQAFITVKGRNRGAERDEWEFPIPVGDACEMMARLPVEGVIEKTRHIVPYAGHRWEVDVFGGRHAGLILAEVELQWAEEPVELPPFVGEEVSGNPAYYNSNLANN